ncbi:MAG: sulfonate ABC transporter [Patescibacteria group bacterium]|nr:sulfonate ABC transporter [Patescibacteria group bacterium]
MDKKLQCPECKNDITLEKEFSDGDVIECSFCGIELEVVGKNEDGTLRVEIIEEEK